MIKKSPFLFLIFIFLTTSISAEELANVSPEQLIALQDKNALIIDIRTEKEWESTGIIPNSHKLKFFTSDGKFNTELWLEKLEKLKTSKDQAIVLVCRSGNRSKTVGDLLVQKRGMKNIYHLTSGITQWMKSNHKIAKTCSPQSSC